MYSVHVSRDSDGNFTLGLAMMTENYEYESTELLQYLRTTLRQIGSKIRKCNVYFNDTFDIAHAMELGWLLVHAYGCASFVYDSDKSRYVELEVLYMVDL